MLVLVRAATLRGGRAGAAAESAHPRAVELQASGRHRPSGGFAQGHGAAVPVWHGGAAPVLKRGEGFEEHLHGKDSPGPVYEPDQSMGRQAASGRGSGPAFVFGSEQCHTDPKVRSPMERRAAAIPGPGQYTLEGSCNPQANSLRRSRPAFGMGSATRDQAGMASLENARAPAVLGGKFSPGVGMYDEKTMAFRKVINSTKPNGPTHVFGTDEKLARNRTTGHLAPGPGSYCV
eukprot:CAMPEP_0114264600 /NCGR_PEP_ID=MMETSP0058-20121206/23309_1 /TAXON_ID=36894 /ORGANISM="Pyramimonas parkeae, CCMP726" /LENGTH=232 /DNA_ID=CAMNT_0001381317 /DNA_START=690 /DNA_END=1389 /DNA_ORIENTATION=-